MIQYLWGVDMHLIQADESVFIDGEKITVIDTDDGGWIRYSLIGFEYSALVGQKFNQSFLAEVKKINNSDTVI